MDSDVRVIDVSMDMDTVPLDPSIEIIDNLEPEVIELDSSCDTVATTYADSKSPVYDSAERVPSPDCERLETLIRHRRDTQSVRSNDVDALPVFKVMFRDESVSRRYRQPVKDFLRALLRKKLPCKKDVNESNLTLEIWDDEVDYKDEEVLDVENESALNDSVQCDDAQDSLFTIDKRPNVKNDLDIPTYGQKYESTFEENRETPKDLMPKLNCFNCKGNHNLRDCSLPKNQSNINKNRKEFAAKYSAGVRYHMSEDQRFSHMVPGQLSQKLRKALGLKDNQLPKHIYRMRLLGYPPGWLEEARLQHSGLSLFNSDGIAESDINKEEGEIITNVNKDQYDVKRIYDFPGFNVPPPPGTADDSHMYWVPQMQIMHSKQMMLLNLQGKEADDGYKRKKLKLPPPVNSVNNVEISDMDIEDTEGENIVENVSLNGHFISPLPKDSVQVPPVQPVPPLPPLPPPPLPPPPPPSEWLHQTTDDSDSQSQELPSFDFADDTTSLTNSPSLSELERRKKLLLMEIEETNSQSNSDSVSIKTDSNSLFVSETPFSSITVTPSTSRRSSIQDSIKSDLQCCPDTSLKNDFNTTLNTLISDKVPQFNSTPIRLTSQKSSDTNQASVKSIHLGTPILPSTSPYNKLPSSEKFSKDICNVINFENLPDSTGKYEQMSGVLQRVRSTMARLHE
ncbi:zinc finger CCHC domain-containing protein 8 homolog isoform X1 [Temnothorax curvispinosus]|uniref:Zinc finger CCHC domain-containing protein 8 homolog isoform X1 n=1 Tax=Temnothorax curvispinosus TaxID=300111 RepID=A0A6J1PRZ7_9HYME|nr:zinc finger CCHC domain-containing protein 8 homolog isoform X1 [Temnothorax curvispinosus]